ncbi:carbamoyl phosphate synthase small subunit [Candidatus Peregrinibacteria bacterium RIFCSPLOWO2_02_FULL_39_10]|nr:MAG: carbamoyl phosphate synthase small subunit [Candidatus Peregrinibacteria bacterium RIFCSPLOWO2_02_FULL_39_10]
MKSAKLVLKDGTTLLGKSFGAELSTAGEVVFNTGMIGYPESLTDPSYTGQILTLTYPLIGNYGISPDTKDKDKIKKYFESDRIQIKGLVVSEYSENYSHFSASKSLSKWLIENKIPAITGIDTRALTQKIRQHGTILGKIIIENSRTSKPMEFYNPDLDNLVAKVSIKKPRIYKRGKKRIICIDCGMKNNILRSLLLRNLTVIRVPWNYDFLKAKIKFDGIFMSNGPGDPAMLTELHEIIRKAMELKKPIFGICLGCQIMAIATGAKTYKLKFGHRSQNQPCVDEETSHCYITSQNHGFAINEKTLKPGWKVWLRNANDSTVEGIKHKTMPFFSCQFHPEATPGPTDTNLFFDQFVKMVFSK